MEQNVEDGLAAKKEVVQGVAEENPAEVMVED